MRVSSDGRRAARLRRHHRRDLSPCPHLPESERVLTAGDFKIARGANEEERCVRAQLCAQSLWLQGYPGQALLMLNHAFACPGHVGREVYEAVAWILEWGDSLGFIGNPRRHYQHLATRMNESSLKLLRQARAWNCWLLAGIVCPHFPNDDEQVRSENFELPTAEEVRMQSYQLLGPSETEGFMAAVSRAGMNNSLFT